MSWKPLLEGELADLAQRRIHGLARELETARAPREGPLAGGLAGLALFYGYLARTTGNDRFAQLAERHLDESLERMDASLRAGLFTGFTGIAWTCQHLSGLLTGEIPPDLVSDVDEAVLEAVGARPSHGIWPHDLTYGLAGLGCYAVDHPDRTFAAALLERIVGWLERMAVPLDGGIAWRTSPRFLEPDVAKRFPEGWFDLGVAHGTPGVLGMLGRAIGAGLVPPAARDLLDRGAGALLASRRPLDGGSRYSRMAAVSRPFSCCSAWCQGDPGIAAALLCAARHAGDASLEAEALATALHDCARPDEEKGVQDATLCHGTAGLGHLYNRLYQATGLEALAAASRRWFERALKEGSRQGLGEEASYFLEGESGIGLALIAATSDLDPAWDRPMLFPDSRP